MSKWRSIRDNYVRNRKKIKEAKKSGAAAKKIRRYIYEDQLRFLEKSIEMRSTISTITEESQEIQEDIVVEMEKSSPEEKEDEQQSFGALPTPTTSKNNPGFDALLQQQAKIIQ